MVSFVQGSKKRKILKIYARS